MKKKILLSLMGCFICLTALAQLPARGKYYRIVNEQHNKVMKENWGAGTVTCNTLDEKDYTQIWQYTTSGALQNVYTARYLQDQPYGSTIFNTGTTAQTVTFTTHSDGHLGINTNGNCLHCDNSSNLVKWQDNTNEANHWTVQEVSLTAEQIKAAREEHRTLSDMSNNSGKYSELLMTFFTNELGTELKAEYAVMDDEALKAAMLEAGLPAMLGDVAVKIKNQWWNDTDKSAYADANKYAKEFRVASYQPYSDANNWREKMNTYSPSFMGNPTGIYAQNKDIIHVFVGNDIPEGATLYLTPVRNHGRIGARNEGTQLKKGYNAVIATTDSLMYFVNYVVNTIPTSGVNGKTQPIAKISDFPNLDIHIEGGQCVGYYHKPAESSAEEDAKFQYLSTNANDKMYFVVKGESTIFYFLKHTFTKTWPKTIWNSINWFDRLRYWEWGLVGLNKDVADGLLENGTEYSRSGHPFNIKGGDDFYPTYCNNPSMAIEGPAGKNPHATTFYTSYPGTGGVESSFNAERSNFDVWCAGHEHGHQMQGPYNLESCSESSVNLPSNVITHMTGYRLSRGWNFAQNYEYVAKEVPFGLRDISITMRMYYNLFLYYHTAGKKKDFYPTFVKSLREDPMDFSKDADYQHPEYGWAGHHRATKTWIHLYKKACDAAQEDLTEYFRLWGFFVPCDKVWFGDYSNYWVSLTQKEIDDAIAEVKAKGYPENLQIMFVEDRQIMRERTDIWASTATGKEKYKPTNWGEWYTAEQLKAEYGDVGDVLTYIDGSANTSEYTYIQSGNKITLKGKGGVGFIVYDKDGNNSYMSNRYNFEIPAELASAGFTIRAINADGTSSEVKNGADSATDAEKLAILQAAIEASKEMTSLEDATGKKVGYYSSEDLATLKGYVADANTAIAEKNVANYIALANSINIEILKLQSGNRMKQIVPNAIYHISCVRKVEGTTRYLTASGSGFDTQAGVHTAIKKEPFGWAFVPTGEDNVYYLQNREPGKMMAAELNEKGGVTNVKITEADPDLACTVKVEALGDGKFGIRPKDNTYLNMHNQGYITVWGSADEGSQWYIQEYEEFEEVTDEMMNELIANTEELVNKVCDYTVANTKFELQSTDENAPGYTSTNQPDASKPNFQIEKAIDGIKSTYFISNRSNNNATEPHHIKVDLGQEGKTQSIQFHIYGNSTFNYATAINVYAGNNDTYWTKVASIEGMKVAYTSEVLKANYKFRYWKFDVIATTGTVTDNSEFPWFTAKEFELYQADVNITMKEGFESITNTMITNCKNGISEVEAEMNKTFRTKLGDYTVYSQLKKYYTNLYNKASAIDPTVDINDIEADGKAEGVIYDLSGRKVSKTGNGIYIIGGKKVVK